MDTITINVTLNTSPVAVSVVTNPVTVTVNYQVARDAYQLAKAEGFVGTRPEWLASLNGTDGREIELQTSATHVQWRYQGTVGWTDLIALTAITGAPGQDGADSTVPGPDGDDGREVELQSSGGYIQWRYVGDTSWTNLVALAVITGPAGSDANVTTANVGTALAAAASKTTPVDADSIPILDSADSNAPKLLSFANLWAWSVTQLIALANIDGLKTFLQNVVFNGTANRMPNQTALAADSVMTRALADIRTCYMRSGRILVLSPQSGWTANAVVNGSSTSISTAGNALIVITSTTLDSEAYIRTGAFAPDLYTYPGNEAVGSASGINWGMSTYWGFRYRLTHGNNNSPNSGTVGYVRFGHSRTLATYGPLTTAGVGWKFEGGFVYPMVHNGTTLNLSATAAFTTASPYSPANHLEIIGDGAGNYGFYVNGALMETLTGGPTGYSGQEGTGISVALKNTTGGANTNGWLYISNGTIIFAYP